MKEIIKDKKLKILYEKKVYIKVVPFEEKQNIMKPYPAKEAEVLIKGVINNKILMKPEIIQEEKTSQTKEEKIDNKIVFHEDKPELFAKEAEVLIKGVIIGIIDKIKDKITLLKE
jgi:hypothetical protein